MKAFIDAIGGSIVSRWIGSITYFFSSIPLPNPVLNLWSNTIGIDLNEAEKPLSEYPTIKALFTRGLKADLRPVNQQPNVLISPCDGFLLDSAPLTDTTKTTVKGTSLLVSRFLKEINITTPFKGQMITIYLSPKDCHRIFSPVNGALTQTRHTSGTLNSVNPSLTKNLKTTYLKNKRLSFLYETDHGKVALIMVGAINVGKLLIKDNDNHVELPLNTPFSHSNIIHQKGDWIGTFFLGSTVVLLTEKPIETKISINSYLKIGQAVGQFTDQC